MAGKRIVITGLGIIASNGIGKTAFSEAIFAGVSGIKPVSLFDTASFKTKTAGEIKDFSPQEFLGPKGLRTLDRSTKLVASAAKLALDDAQLEIMENNSADVGISIGNTLGSVNSITEFDKEAMVEGPYYVNPALFPNTVINSPASQVSIKFGIKGFNSTISTGFCAGLDAISYGVDLLESGKAKILLAGAVEELCIQTYLGFYKTGCLAGLQQDSLELSCPFDKRRNGMILGEGSAVLVLESLESALGRKAKIYAQVSGAGMGFDAHKVNEYNPSGDGLKRAMRMALENAGTEARNIDYISSAANSTQLADLIETEAIKDVFGSKAVNIGVSSIKSMLGECYSASGAIQTLAAALAIEKQAIPPTINYQMKDERCDLDYVTNEARNCAVNNVLINAFGPSGCNSSLIISRFNG
jgi:3-oxoacyl-[acyl-carrier-protein] synthase II